MVNNWPNSKGFLVITVSSLFRMGKYYELCHMQLIILGEW